MIRVHSGDLMKDRRVIKEIDRHRWIESQKAGYDIGFEEAANDWFVRFSTAWVKYYWHPETRRVRKDKFRNRWFIYRENESGPESRDMTAKSRKARRF